MKKLIETGSTVVETINVNSIDITKFIVGKRNHDRILFVPTSYRSHTYSARALNNSLAYGNGYGTSNNDLTLQEWINFFGNDTTFYQLDTLKEVFEFAFEG